MLRKVRDLHEVNPMLGHRGVRLGITYPEIYDMQIRAILEAEAECLKLGVSVNPEIMVPQVITVQELKRVRASVDRIRKEIENQYGVPLTFKFGSMIETVRACTRAGDLAGLAEFFSFGTNDLTQATYSFSREDAENKFLPLYTDSGILHDNPFEILDIKGVGVLMQLTVNSGRQTNPGLKIGICGEQGGHPESIRFCHEIGLNYVSCSPHRVPVARLAAAQALLKSVTENSLTSVQADSRPVLRSALQIQTSTPVTPAAPKPQPEHSAVPTPPPRVAEPPQATMTPETVSRVSEPPLSAVRETRVEAAVRAIAEEEAQRQPRPAATPQVNPPPVEPSPMPETTLPVDPATASPASSEEPPPVPAAPARETRVEAALRALSEEEAGNASTPAPEESAPPPRQAQVEKKAKPAKSSAPPKKEKGGAMGLIGKAFRAIKNIDKKTS
jgi:hypothetical protein